MANQIPVSQANEMIQQYLNYMTSLGVDMNNQTRAITFPTGEVLKFMNENMQYTDEYRICLGVYPSGDSRAGKMSVIVWPYKNGQPAMKPDDPGKGTGGGKTIAPFNDGGLIP
ncbi:MAG: hypothetical protein ABI480_06085 [Chitinophagaceae bacterium]